MLHKDSENFLLEVACITSVHMPLAQKSQVSKLDIREVGWGWGGISSLHREVSHRKEWQYFNNLLQLIIKIPSLTPPLRKLSCIIWFCFF